MWANVPSLHNTFISASVVNFISIAAICKQEILIKILVLVLWNSDRWIFMKTKLTEGICRCLDQHQNTRSCLHSRSTVIYRSSSDCFGWARSSHPFCYVILTFLSMHITRLLLKFDLYSCVLNINHNVEVVWYVGSTGVVRQHWWKKKEFKLLNVFFFSLPVTLAQNLSNTGVAGTIDL